jgi:hypothetical protein
VRDKRTLTDAEAKAAWAILVEIAGARGAPDDGRDFVRHATRDCQVEYRFGGALGSGGKFRWDGWDARIDFYRENRTALREAICGCAGRRFAELLGQPPKPFPDAATLLGECASAMEATSRAMADLHGLRLARGDADRALRPKAKAVREAEYALTRTRDALDAAALRARESLRMGDAPQAS